MITPSVQGAAGRFMPMAAIALACALTAAGCQTPLRSAIYGDLGPGRVGSTILQVPEGYRSVSVDGELALSSGGATVRLTVPDGSARVFDLRAGDSGLPATVRFGPYSAEAAAGDWTLTVDGDAAASGTYSVSLEAR